jgi:hypothetical protein
VIGIACNSTGCAVSGFTGNGGESVPDAGAAAAFGCGAFNLVTVDPVG